MLLRHMQSTLGLRPLVCVLTIFVGSACANDTPLAPHLSAPRVAAHNVSTGDEVLLFMGWSIADESLELIVTGRSAVIASGNCAPAYTYDVTTVEQKSASGSTHFPGAEKPNSEET